MNPERRLAESLRTVLLDYVRHNHAVNSARDRARRILAWMYVACPPAVVAESVESLSSPRPIDLHTVGLCGQNAQHLATFLRRAAHRLSKTASGANNWLRALRDAARFQEHCLSDSLVKRVDVDALMGAVLHVLEQEIGKRSTGRRFDNCVLAIPYLLKRRRYEPDFANEGSELYVRMERLLSHCVDAQGSFRPGEKQKRVASKALEYLRSQADGNPPEDDGSYDDDGEDDGAS